MSQNIKENTRAFYSYVNSKRITKDNIGPLRNEEGKLVSDNQGMGTVLNKFFSSVFTKENVMVLPQASTKAVEGKGETIENMNITEACVSKAIDSLKKNKAAGIDGMNTTIL